MHVAQKRPITARTNWSCSWPIRCEATVSLVGVVQRRLAKQERHRALRRSSWSFRPDAIIHISWQVVNAFLSALASRQPSVFPRHRWTGCDLACDEVGLLLSVHNVLHDSYLAFLVSCGVKRARPFVPASGPSAAAALPDCPALQRQQGGCNGEDENGDDDGDGSEDEVALQGDAEAVPDADWSSGLTETDWHTMNKQYRLGGYNFVVAAPLAELLMLRTCLEPFRHLLAAHLLLSGESWEKEQQAADISFRLGKAGAEPSTIQSVHCCKRLRRSSWAWCLRDFSMGSIGSIYWSTSALSMCNTSSSGSGLEWAAQRKNTCSCPAINFQRNCFCFSRTATLAKCS